MENLGEEKQSSLNINEFTIMKGFRLYREHVADNFIHQRIWHKLKKTHLTLLIALIILILIQTLIGYFTLSGGPTSAWQWFNIVFSLVFSLFYLLAYLFLPYVYTKRCVGWIWNEDSLLKTTPVSNETLFMGIMTPLIHTIFLMIFVSVVLSLPNSIFSFLSLAGQNELGTVEILGTTLLTIIIIPFQIFSASVITIIVFITAAYKTLFLPGVLLPNTSYTIWSYIQVYLYLVFLYFLLACCMGLLSIPFSFLLISNQPNMTSYYIFFQMFISIIIGGFVFSLFAFYMFKNFIWKKDFGVLRDFLNESRSV